MNDLRNRMVDEQIIRRGVKDPAVIKAMRTVLRHQFVPRSQAAEAYEDKALSIGKNQTISQPYMVALMTAYLCLDQEKTALEIGTGSGYQTAVLAEICKEVFTVERIESLCEKARRRLTGLDYRNIRYHLGDGSIGWADECVTFDGIIVTASSPGPLKHLLDYLNPGGRMLIPMGEREDQRLMLFKKENEKMIEQEICRCAFVPLTGEFGWK